MVGRIQQYQPLFLMLVLYSYISEEMLHSKLDNSGLYKIAQQLFYSTASTGIRLAASVAGQDCIIGVFKNG